MGAVFSMFGGLYYWFDKITGVNYSEILGQIHFWTFFVGVNLTFFPMHFLGVAGMPRRVPDYPDAFYIFNKIASWGSYISALSSLVFFYAVFEAFASSTKDKPKNSMIISCLLVILSLVYLLLSTFKVLKEPYLYYIEFIMYRLLFIIVFISLLKNITNLPLVKGLNEEFAVFNKPPKGTQYVQLIRKHHFECLFVAYVTYALATTYFVENYIVSYILGIISLMLVVLYLYQFVVYMKNYLQDNSSEVPKKGS